MEGSVLPSEQLEVDKSYVFTADMPFKSLSVSKKKKNASSKSLRGIDAYINICL